MLIAHLPRLDGVHVHGLAVSLSTGSYLLYGTSASPSSAVPC